MFRRISKAERERRAARAELETTVQALHANERAFKEAQTPLSRAADLPARRPAVPLAGTAALLRADRESL